MSKFFVIDPNNLSQGDAISIKPTESPHNLLNLPKSPNSFSGDLSQVPSRGVKIYYADSEVSGHESREIVWGPNNTFTYKNKQRIHSTKKDNQFIPMLTREQVLGKDFEGIAAAFFLLDVMDGTLNNKDIEALCNLYMIKLDSLLRWASEEQYIVKNDIIQITDRFILLSQNAKQNGTAFFYHQFTPYRQGRRF